MELTQSVIEKAKDGFIVALTGAGISAGSGIPTFRGEGGLWRNYRPEQLATLQAFQKDPKLVWEFYSWRLEKVWTAQPNAAHLALSTLEKEGILDTLITQNIDDLHERAGSKSIVKIHGSIIRVKCASCGQKGGLDSIPKEIPLCEECGGMYRPDVVWFGEALDPDILRDAFTLASKCDMMLVVGTSGVVRPAADLPFLAKRKNPPAIIIEFNIDPTPITSIADQFFEGPADQTLTQFVNLLI